MPKQTSRALGFWTEFKMAAYADDLLFFLTNPHTTIPDVLQGIIARFPILKYTILNPKP